MKVTVHSLEGNRYDFENVDALVDSQYGPHVEAGKKTLVVNTAETLAVIIDDRDHAAEPSEINGG